MLSVFNSPLRIPLTRALKPYAEKFRVAFGKTIKKDLY
jgi:hypothetical protein